MQKSEIKEDSYEDDDQFERESPSKSQKESPIKSIKESPIKSLKEEEKKKPEVEKKKPEEEKKKLARMIEHYPELWSLKHPLYKKPQLHVGIWNSIAESLNCSGRERLRLIIS